MGEATAVGFLVSPEEYLAGELTAVERSEFVRGRVYPMPGVSVVHAQLATNLTIDIGSFVDNTDCRVFVSDLKLRCESGEVYYYPDLMICCDPADDAEYWRERPRHVFEISSPETRRIDDGEKKAAYFAIDSIESYVQVSQSRLLVIVHRRGDDRDGWVEEILTKPDDELRLDGLGFSLPLRQLYRRTGLLESD